MENGSFSLRTLRFRELVVDEVGVLCQKLFFSGGEGCLLSADVSPKNMHYPAYRKVDAAVINHCERTVSTHKSSCGGALVRHNYTARDLPLNLYSFGSSLLPLMLNADADFAPAPATSDCSNPFSATFRDVGRTFSSWEASGPLVTPGFREK